MPIDDPTDRTIAALAALAEVPAADDFGPTAEFIASLEVTHPWVAETLLAGLPAHELPPGLIEALRISYSLLPWYQRDLANARLNTALLASRIETGDFVRCGLPPRSV